MVGLPLSHYSQVDTLGARYKFVNFQKKNLCAEIPHAVVLEIQRSDGRVLVQGREEHSHPVVPQLVPARV